MLIIILQRLVTQNPNYLFDKVLDEKATPTSAYLSNPKSNPITIFRFSLSIDAFSLFQFSPDLFLSLTRTHALADHSQWLRSASASSGALSLSSSVTTIKICIGSDSSSWIVIEYLMFGSNQIWILKKLFESNLNSEKWLNMNANSWVFDLIRFISTPIDVIYGGSQ